MLLAGFLVGGIVGDCAGSSRVQHQLDGCEHLAKEKDRQDTIRGWRRDCEEQIKGTYEALSPDGREFFRENCVRQKEHEEWKW